VAEPSAAPKSHGLRALLEWRFFSPVPLGELHSLDFAMSESELRPAWRDITSFPEFMFSAMAVRGSGTLEAESKSDREPLTDWIFSNGKTGSIEVLAKTRPDHFRTFLARFARVCNIDLYGGSDSFSRGACSYMVQLRNSQQTGFGIRINLNRDNDAEKTLAIV